MNKPLDKYVIDIYNAVLLIEEFLKLTPTLDSFVKDIRTHSAVERQLTIIGEATNFALKLNPQLPVTSARRIVDFRNVLIHAYDLVNAQTVWKILQTDLPLLKKEVHALIKPESLE